jgi:hypothetical protein
MGKYTKIWIYILSYIIHIFKNTIEMGENVIEKPTFTSINIMRIYFLNIRRNLVLKIDTKKSPFTR